MDPLLIELRPALQRLGYLVVPHGDHLCVRLALAASVRIYSSDGQVRLVPQFGPFSRSRGLIATSTATSTVVGVTVFALGVTPVAFLAGFIGMVALAHDACRFVVTEACITRLQQVITEMDRKRASLVVPGNAALPRVPSPAPGTRPALSGR